MEGVVSFSFYEKKITSCGCLLGSGLKVIFHWFDQTFISHKSLFILVTAEQSSRSRPATLLKKRLAQVFKTTFFHRTPLVAASIANKVILSTTEKKEHLLQRVLFVKRMFGLKDCLYR